MDSVVFLSSTAPICICKTLSQTEQKCIYLFVSLAFLKCTGRRILRVMIFFFILYSTCIKSGCQLLSCIGKKTGFDLNNVIICTDLHVSFFLVEGLIFIRFIRFPSTKKNNPPAYGQQFWLLLFMASVDASC